MIIALDRQFERALRARRRSEALRARATELIAKAQAQALLYRPADETVERARE
jgi:hypothetical protein